MLKIKHTLLFCDCHHIYSDYIHPSQIFQIYDKDILSEMFIPEMKKAQDLVGYLGFYLILINYLASFSSPSRFLYATLTASQSGELPTSERGTKSGSFCLLSA